MNESNAPSMSFGERVNICCERAGSAAALARLVGLSHTAIAKYQNNEAEPAVSTVVKIADATGVSLEWLAAERGPMLVSVAPKKPKKAKADNEAVLDFSKRLREVYALSKRRIGALHLGVPLPEGRFQELLDGARPELEDFVALADTPLVPLRYLLGAGGGPDHSDEALPNECAYMDLIAKLRAIDDKRRINEWPSSGQGSTTREPYWQAPLFELMAQIYESLKPQKLLTHKYAGDSLRRVFQNGDCLLAVAESSPSKPGIYVLSPTSAQAKGADAHYVARIGIGKSAYRITYDHRSCEPSDLDPEKVQVVGRVVRILRSIGD